MYMDLTELSNNGGHHFYVAERPVPYTEGDTQLIFVTSYDHAEDPCELFTKLELILTPEGRAALKAML